MIRAITCVVLLTMLGTMQSLAAPPPAPIKMTAGRFGTVTVYKPKGMAQSVVIFLSGDGGWNLGVVNMAVALRDQGAVVIGADVTHYLHALGGKSACQLI